MALVVFLRGANVGGHRTLRPAALAAELQHLDVVNIGAAGTFVVRRQVGLARLRAEFSKRLPFSAEIVICRGGEILDLISQQPFGSRPVAPGITRFVSVLSRRPRSVPAMPLNFPASGGWLLRVVGRSDRFVFGLYRRHMKVIGYLGALDRVFGVPVTTRNWNTITAIATILARGPAPR